MFLLFLFLQFLLKFTPYWSCLPTLVSGKGNLFYTIFVWTFHLNWCSTNKLSLWVTHVMFRLSFLLTNGATLVCKISLYMNGVSSMLALLLVKLCIESWVCFSFSKWSSCLIRCWDLHLLLIYVLSVLIFNRSLSQKHIPLLIWMRPRVNWVNRVYMVYANFEIWKI